MFVSWITMFPVWCSVATASNSFDPAQKMEKLSPRLKCRFTGLNDAGWSKASATLAAGVSLRPAAP